MPILFFMGITYQDFKSREISVWLLVVLILFPTLNNENWGIEYVKDVLLSMSFLSVQVLLTILYFKVKGVDVKELLQKYIGMGDLLFFVVIAFYFSPFNYVLFLNVSLLFSLIAYYGYRLLVKNTSVFIPLAGLQAMCLVVVLLLPISLRNDNFILQILL